MQKYLINEFLKDEKLFNDIHDYMLKDNWTWFNVGVPSVKELKDTFISLCKCGGIAATGGLHVVCDEASIDFTFEKYDKGVIFSKFVDIRILRKYKLKRIL